MLHDLHQNVAAGGVAASRLTCSAGEALAPCEDFMPVQNAEIAVLLDRAAELLEIKGENPFRTRAYRRAARVRNGFSPLISSSSAARSSSTAISAF